MTRHPSLIRIAVLCLAAAAAPVLLASCASAVRDRRVLIMNFENGLPGGEQATPYATSLAEMMTSCLANSPRVAVLDRQALGGLMERTSGPKALHWQEIGKRAGADYVIVGSISRLDRNYLLNARLLSVRTGEIVKGSSISRYAQREEDIYPAVQAVCQTLSYQLKYLAELYDARATGQPAPSAPAAAAAPAPVPVPAGPAATAPAPIPAVSAATPAAPKH